VERHSPEEFAMFGVNTDDTGDDEARAKYAAQLEEFGVTWPNLVVGSTAAAQPRGWGISYYPTIFVVDAEGVIRHVDARGEQLEKVVGELIEEARAKAQ
jgi:hypothetical protein